MGIHRLGKVAVLCTLTLGVSACGGGGGSNASLSGGGSTALLTHQLTVISHDPGTDTVQVPVDASITIDFDGAIATGCLQLEDTWLRVSGSSVDLAIAFSTMNNGHSLVVTPTAPLIEETDYTMQLAALTCDVDGRLLEENYNFSFRSFDLRPPQILNTSIGQGATGVTNTSNFSIDFDEELDGTSITTGTVQLSDLFGTPLAVTKGLAGNRLMIDPLADLAGDQSYRLLIEGGPFGVQDRAGNHIENSLTISFHTAADHVAPMVLSNWPSTPDPLSPALQPTIRFTESMDPFSVESSSLSFTDQFTNIVNYQVEVSPNQKTLRLIPSNDLISGRSYTISLTTGPGAVTDLSGNTLATPALISLNIGSDIAAPQVLSTSPAEAATSISPNARPLVRFSESLDPASIDASRVFLTGPDGPVAATLSRQNGDQDVLLIPDADLAAGSEYRLTLRGGQDGLRDLAGNPLLGDRIVHFTTSEDPTTPSLQVWPRHGETQTPPSVHISILSDSALDPSTLSPGTVRILDSQDRPVAGTLSLLRSDRLIRFVPDFPWASAQTYTITVQGGAGGLREISGNWLSQDMVSVFRVRSAEDLVAPTVTVTINSLADQRKGGRTLPPNGFEIEVSAFDQFGFSLDMASTLVELTGPGESPDPETIFATAIIDGSSLRWRASTDLNLGLGEYTLRARVSDLSGNQGVSDSLRFQVKSATIDALPFERTHVVWVRFDLDRDGNGTPDFQDDLLRLGFITAGDPARTNQRMTAVVRDAILAQCNHIFERKPTGGRVGSESVAIQFSHLQPIGVAHMQIACGGLDPEGDPNRVFGDPSTGTLGRAFFDYRNANVNDLDTGRSPGVGVFPGELFLFEARVHQQVFPSFLTSFANRFLALSPPMGGTPAGTHTEDATVLAENFNFLTGTTVQKARFNSIFLAADDWALAIGTILAHEVGHSVGLVASGSDALALHGDLSLHNEFTSSVDVMAAAVGYDALINLDFRMRDLNIAYLRQRVLLK